jgi:hypothetical protein
MTTTQTTHDCPPDTLYVKKAIPVSCIRWDGKGFDDGAPAWAFKAIENGTLCHDKPFLKVRLHDGQTIPSYDTCWPGDWIIRGVDGEVYRCPARVFTMAYEPFQPTVRDGVSVQDFKPAGKNCPTCFAPMGAR